MDGRLDDQGSDEIAEGKHVALGGNKILIREPTGSDGGFGRPGPTTADLLRVPVRGRTYTNEAGVGLGVVIRGVESFPITHEILVGRAGSWGIEGNEGTLRVEQHVKDEIEIGPSPAAASFQQVDGAESPDDSVQEAIFLSQCIGRS
jgi:hypothetical protein